MRRAAIVLILGGLAVAVMAGAALMQWWPSARTGEPVGAAAVLCADLDVERAGRVREPDLDEISGAVTGRAAPDVLWVVEDSGDPVVYALAADGGRLASFEIAGARNRDWEDLALGPGPEPGRSYLYVGDIGDNGERRERIVVFRLPEPDVSAVQAGGGVVAAYERLAMRYEDGPRDAETLLVDPVDASVVVVTKDASGSSGVYRGVPSGDAETLLGRVGELELGLAGMATGGDLSSDGGLAVVRTYSSVFVWGRLSGEDLSVALARPPCRAPRIGERQGEAIALDADGRGYRTVGEGSGAAIRHWRG